VDTRNPKNSIRVNDVQFTIAEGHPVGVVRKQGGRMLAGINLAFTIGDGRRREQIAQLLAQDTVDVDDPFADRCYRAMIRRTADPAVPDPFADSAEPHFRVELREVDSAEASLP
jgi:hypothetical protein